MNLKLIKSLLLVGIVAIVFTACDNSHPGFKKNENGIYYQIVTHVDSTANVKADSGMYWILTMSYGTKDSLLFDAKQTGQQSFDIPFQKPDYKGDINEALSMLSKGDSAVFVIKADSFFLKTAHSPEVPEIFKTDNDMYFYVKIFDILSTEELQAQKEAELQARKAAELSDLTVFLSGNYPDLQPTESGLFLIKEKDGKGKMPKDGDILNFDFRVSTLNGPLLYDSEAAGRPLETEKGKPYDTKGFTEGLNTMRVGDELTLIVPSKLAFGDRGRQGVVEPYTTMVYWVRLNSFVTKEQHEKELAEKKAKEEQQKEAYKNQEQPTINKYVTDNNVTATPTASGLYYIETLEGTGEQAQTGDKVKVHYTGTLLDGTKFDSSYDRGNPLEITLGKHQVIEGWEEGIALMKAGGKATFIIPSALAYGPRGRGGVIHPYAPLKFDIELIEVTKPEPATTEEK